MKPYLQCPICKPKIMSWVILEEGLRAQQCETCGGVWLGAIDYQNWLHQERPRATVTTPYADAPEAPDIQSAKICPDDGHLMSRYKVGRGIDFTLDRCATCNGVWFDPQQWEVVRHHELHRDVHSMFTEHWQRGIRADAQRAHVERLYTEKLGAETYAEIQRIKQWLAEHPQQAMLMAFLMDDNPYQLK
jgi:Zn-finger nucleic acid-binding protein